jgi:hypothetical protein
MRNPFLSSLTAAFCLFCVAGTALAGPPLDIRTDLEHQRARMAAKKTLPVVALRSSVAMRVPDAAPSAPPNAAPPTAAWGNLVGRCRMQRVEYPEGGVADVCLAK